jgi:DNA-3-methyladenine glycosylase II
VGQQLSGKAADTIFNRFKALFPNGLLPETILKEADEKLRGVGLSNAKTKYIKDLAQRVLNQDLHLHSLVEMKDEEVIAELVKVKGIGNWTAEMFLIFTLQRPDVYSLGDLGLTKAVMKLYGYKEKPTADQLLKHSKIWSPYRSIASRALWKYLDTPNERTVGK